MKRWLVLLLALAWHQTSPALAQTRAADSLHRLLQAAPRPDTLRIRRLQAWSNELLAPDLPRAIAALEEALALSRRIGDAVGEGRALISLGTAERLRADYPQARRYTRQARQLFTRRANKAGLGQTYLQLSLIESMQGDPPAAVLAALQGLPYAEQVGDRVTQTQLQYMLGSIYVQIGSYKEALPVLLATLANGKAVGDHYLEVATLSLLGNAYRMLKQWPEALAYFRRAMRLNQQLKDLKSVASDEISLAELYAEQGQYRQALEYGLRARARAKAHDDTYNLAPAELAIARIYLAMQRPDSAILLARRGFAQGQRTRTKENLRSASDILARAYAQRNDFRPAYRYQGLWVAYNDSIAGEKTQLRITTRRYSYELSKKQAQIALLTKTRQLQAQKAARQRSQLYGLLAGLLSAVLVMGLLWRNVYLKKRANRILNEKNDHIARQRDDLDRTLTELKMAQSQLVQSEKMVALAALMGGVAHEIQNPLNFVNNFSEVSLELVAELEEEQRQPARDPELEADLLNDLKQNLRKIHQHGFRAGGIIKGMLEHAHGTPGERRTVDLNALVQDYLRLACHGLQAKHRDLVVTRTFALDPNLGGLHLEPQEIGRVLLNLFTNALYAVRQKAAALGPAYVPEVRVSTRRVGPNVEIRVRDNGTGIPPAVLKSIFDPFFTTKPPGDGTGLGLSLSYDIVTKGYGGQLTVDTQAGEYTEFVVTLPWSATPARRARQYDTST